MECVWHSTHLPVPGLPQAAGAAPRPAGGARAMVSCLLSWRRVRQRRRACSARAAPRALRLHSVRRAGRRALPAAGLLCLVAVSWTTHDVVQNFYKPAAAQRHEVRDRAGPTSARIAGPVGHRRHAALPGLARRRRHPGRPRAAASPRPPTAGPPTPTRTPSSPPRLAQRV